MKKRKYQAKGPSSINDSRDNSPQEFVDLHMHTTWSDGDLSVHEVLTICIAKKLKAISITDHDCIEGYFEARQLMENKFPGDSLDIIPGIELSTIEDGSEIHILGYFFDTQNEKFIGRIKQMQEDRISRVALIVEQLNQKGLSITLAEVKAKSTGLSIGRPHVAAVLVEKGFVDNFSDAFRQYLSYQVMKVPEGEKMSSREGIELIQSAGGISILAHPAATNRDDLIERLAGYGLAGIEVYRPKEHKNPGNKYHQIADQLGLIKSGGSDFHSEKKGYNYALGAAKVPHHVVTTFHEFLQQKTNKTSL